MLQPEWPTRGATSGIPGLCGAHKIARNVNALGNGGETAIAVHNDGEHAEGMTVAVANDAIARRFQKVPPELGLRQHKWVRPGLSQLC